MHTKSCEMIHLFVAAISDRLTVARVGCEERNREIEHTNHPAAKAQKYGVWRLLEQAIERTYGIKKEQLSFEKQPSGRWVITGQEPPICFSLSHCDRAVAVALSRAPVGVDIEPGGRSLKPALADKVLAPEEKLAYDALASNEQNDYLLRAWVAKESLYKMEGQGTFSPRDMAPDPAKTILQTVELDGRRYAVALSADAPVETRVCVMDLQACQ